MDPARRDLHRLAAAVAFSALGDMVALITLVLAVHELTGSGLAVSALFAATLVPVVAMAPLAGLLTDRVESVRVLVVASLVQAAAAAGLAFATDSLVALLALTALLTAAAAISLPAEAALTQAIAGRERLSEANSRTETARYVGFGLGPLVSAGATVAADARTALLLNAISFLAMATAAGSLKVRRRPGHEPPATASVRAGARHLWCDAELRVAVGAAVAALAILSITLTADVFYCKDVLGVGDAGYALLTGVWTLGMVIGASRVARRVGQAHLATAALVCLVLQGTGIAGQAALALIPAAVIGFLMGGVGHGAKNTLLRTLIADRTPERVHGRVFASYNALCNAAELVAIGAGGVMVTLLGPSLSLAIAGSAGALLALLGLLALGKPADDCAPVTAPRGRLQPET